jgi:serine/threonine protein kinase
MCRVVIKRSLPDQVIWSDTTPPEPLEFRNAACLESPNVVRIYEWFQDSTYVNFVMEYCPDGTLEEYITQRRSAGGSIPEDVCLLLENFSSIAPSVPPLVF